MDNPNHPRAYAHSKSSVSLAARNQHGKRLHQCFPLRHASNCNSILRDHTHPSSPTSSSSSSCSTSAKCIRYGQPKIGCSVNYGRSCRSGSAKTSPRARYRLRRGTIVAHSDWNSVKRCKFLGNVRSSQDGLEGCKFLGRVVEGSPLISTSESSLRGGIGPGLFNGLAMVDETQTNLESYSHSDIEDELSRSGSNVTWELQSASSQSHSLSQNNKSRNESPMNEEVCSSSRLDKHVSTIRRMWNKRKKRLFSKDSCNIQPFRFVPYALEEAKPETITLPPKVLVPLWMQNLNSHSTK